LHLLKARAALRRDSDDEADTSHGVQAGIDKRKSSMLHHGAEARGSAISSGASGGSGGGGAVCEGCKGAITGKHMVVNDKKWHKEHFVCSVCKISLQQTSFMYKQGALYCKPHYHEVFSPTCAGCGELITTGTFYV
jgi:hypothetical protein